MDSNEREPSYYEVALTHRQLTVGLVVGLSTIAVAFLAGIWIGRGGAPGPVAGGTEAPVTTAANRPDQLTFFGDKSRTNGANAPQPATPIAPKPNGAVPAAAPPKPAEARPPAAFEPAAPTPRETEADVLRRTLEAEMAANRVDGAGKAAPAPAVAPGARVTRSVADGSARAAEAPKPATTGTQRPATAPAPAAPAGTLWIQVYSSPHGERAKEIATKLKKGGFSVRTLVGGTGAASNYRVRVGPYADRAEADRAASRLRREYKLETWLTETE